VILGSWNLISNMHEENMYFLNLTKIFIIRTPHLIHVDKHGASTALDDSSTSTSAIKILILHTISSDSGYRLYQVVRVSRSIELRNRHHFSLITGFINSLTSNVIKHGSRCLILRNGELDSGCKLSEINISLLHVRQGFGRTKTHTHTHVPD